MRRRRKNTHTPPAARGAPAPPKLTALDVRRKLPIAPTALLLIMPARLLGPPGPMLNAGSVCGGGGGAGLREEWRF